MPEFMLTSDASNSNYASTMVAEGPAVKMFERLQAEQIEEDLEVMDRVLDLAVEHKRITQQVRDAIEISATAPTLATRDRLKEAQADEVLVRNEAMSPQTMAARHGLDIDKERELMAEGWGEKDPYGGDEDFPPKKKPEKEPEEEGDEE